MRSNADFIEVTSVQTGKKYLVNKRAIILILPSDETDRAIITTINGDQTYKLFTKETYKDISEEILWCAGSGHWMNTMLGSEPGAPKPPMEETDG